MRYLFEIGVKNAFKSKLRLIMISIFMCCGLTVISLTIGISGSTIDEINSLELNLQARATVTVVNNKGTIPLTVEKRIEQMAGIQSICRDHYFTCKIGDDSQGDESLYARILDFDFENQILEGADDYRNQGVSGILVPDSMKNSTTVRNTGSELLINFDYVVNDELKTDSDFYSVIGYYTEIKEEGDYSTIYMSKDLYDDLISLSQTTPEAKSLILYVNDPEASETIIEEIEGMGYSAYSNDISAEGYLLFVKGLRTIGFVVGLILVALSSIIVMQALNGSVRKREKAIAIMKAFGYTNSKIMFMVLSEVSVYAVVSLMLSAVVNILVGRSITQQLTALFMNTQYTYSFWQFAISVLVIIVFALLAIIRPWIKCSKLNPIDVLKEAV